MDDRIELHWTPELRDSLQATRVVGGTRLAVVAVLVILMGIVELALHQYWLGVLMLVLGPALVVVQVLMSVLVFRRSSTAGTVHRAVVDHDAVRVSTARVTTELAWPMIAEWREAGRIFVLRAGGGRAMSVVVLPKRSLGEDGDSALRQALTERVGPAGRRRAVPLDPAASSTVTTAAAPGEPSGGSGERIELHWTPARADWSEAMRAISWPHRLFPWLGLLIAAGGIAWSVASYRSTPDGYTLNMAFVFMPLAGLLIGSLTALQARALLRRNPLIAAEQRVTLDDSGLRFTIAGTQTSTAWTLYAGFRERRRSFVLRYGKSSLTPVTLLAKRGVVAPHTVDDVRAMLADRLPTCS